MMNDRKQNNHFNQGFTLVEVMVALLIVAVAISALLNQMMTTIDNTGYLRDKTIAHWVALNQQELIYLENQHSNRLLRDQRTGSEEQAGRQWYWRVKPLKVNSQDKNFQQLEISVRADPDDESAIVSLNILIDKYYLPVNP